MSRKIRPESESPSKQLEFQDKLLGALTDETKVAIVLNESECRSMLTCVRYARGSGECREAWVWADEFTRDLEKLIERSFNGRPLAVQSS